MRLLELVLVASLMLVFAAETYALSRAPAAVASTSLALPRIVDEARVLAAAGGDGATLVFTPQTVTRNFALALYRNRPRVTNGDATHAIALERSETLAGMLSSTVAGGGPFAVFLSTAGTVSYAAWTPVAGPLAAEPDCREPLGLTIAAGRISAHFQLPCDSARLNRI